MVEDRNFETKFGGDIDCEISRKSLLKNKEESI
jgi:hypothetical protein